MPLLPATVDLAAEFRVLRLPSQGEGPAPGAPRGVAPAFVLDLRGPEPAAAAAAARLWSLPCPARPGPHLRPAGSEGGLPTRLWPDATCQVRPASAPGSWELTVSAPAGPRPASASALGDRAAGLRDLLAVVSAGSPQELRFTVGDTALAALCNTLPRAGWLFLVICANGRQIGALALQGVRFAGRAALRDALGSLWTRTRDWGARLRAGPRRPAAAPDSPPLAARVQVTVESLSRPFHSRAEIERALHDPGAGDVAPVMDVTFRGRQRDEVADALWGGAAPPGPGLPPPPGWSWHFATRRRLQVRVAEHTVLRLRLGLPGGSADTWLAAREAPCGQPAGAGDARALIWLRLDASTALSLETALARSGWMFVVLRTPEQARGVLAICNAEVLRGPAAR